MSDIVIKAVDLAKQYHIGGPQRTYDRLGEQVVDAFTSPFRRVKKLLRGQATGAAELDEQFWALQKVSFEIKAGEVVGIIGRNGAGKSTLLKVLSRITEPTKGYIDLYGRVGSLLEVGTGFHPELTGRENVYLNGAILGMRKTEIERKFDEIIAFAEIDKFIDTPVKHYSSGMYVRLAFAVAAHLEPEILLVDEVLAVGDVAFQKKCLGKMDDVAQQGRTVLFVSHNMGLLQALCQRGIFLQQGVVHTDGAIGEAVQAYLHTLEQAGLQDLAQRTDRQGRGQVKLVNVEVCNGNGGAGMALTTGSPARFVFDVEGAIAGLSCSFTIFNQLGQRVASFKSDAPGPEDVYDPAMGNRFVCEMEKLLLVAGRYQLGVLLRGGGEWQDYVEAAVTFDVEEGPLDGRVVRPFREVSVCMPHRWQLPVENAL
ncbi:MAG: ABC transporter ATP-binding protein [Anaerolineaceae bacterium]|nr:ABC transporter ATP-binding protein [Anaerolineaceae bacterium]